MTEPLPTSTLPVLPLRDTVVFPGTTVPLLVGRERSKRLVEELAGEEAVELVLVATREPVEEPGPSQLFEVGTVGRIVQVLRFPDGSFRAVVEGLRRVRMGTFTRFAPYLVAEVEPLAEEIGDPVRAEALLRQVRGSFQAMVGKASHLPEQLLTVVASLDGPSRLADFVAASLELELGDRQELLETLDVQARLERLSRHLARELEILEVESSIQEQVEAEVDRNQREFLLRKQLEAIRKELGEGEGSAEAEELRGRLEQAGLPEEARKEAVRELERLEQLPAASPEYHVIRTYLDWMLRFPWKRTTEDHLDVEEAARVLDEDHHDLEKVKDRILEYLAVLSLKRDMRGPILCLVGPPGVGKTSLGRSVARALGREFVRMSLGGVRDEAEIRGHRRTYIGAMPGRIVQSLVRAGTANPVVMLDEIDKLGADFRGDPAAALLEVLDPEQNAAFRDHYLDVPIDLSRVLFITTANVLHTIPPPLRDRLEILEVPGYTAPDKVEIARRYLVPEQLGEHGLDGDEVVFEDEALELIVSRYTREAGVRNLDRRIAAVCRKLARRVVEGDRRPVRVTSELVRELLGPPSFRQKVAEERDEVGVATGLAVTPGGGEVLFVEASLVPGKGQITITGQLGEVMRESAQAAVTYARSRADRLGLDPKWLETTDVHLHVPEGAVPKDGPSAGVTMTTALVSALTGRPVRKTVGMTGEVTLRGKVLPIGGVKEKVLAAHLAGLETVLLPAENDKDLEEIPDAVRSRLDVRPVGHMDEILELALDPGEAEEAA